MKIVVTGKQGQVVQSLIERAGSAGHEVLPLGRPELDLAQTRPEDIVELLEAIRPDAVVSAAAYTAVDKAEGEFPLAHAVNANGPATLAHAAATLGLPLVHLSTDYVFDGTYDRPYKESDPVSPLGVYGRTKLDGEQAVLAKHPDNSAVLRTAWVFSPYGANFAKTMLRLAEQRNEVSVVADQIGNPTNALDIADGIFRITENLKYNSDAALRGLFHMTAAGEASWAGFAERIFAVAQRHAGPHAEVRHITTADYPTPAKRPANSRLDCKKLADYHNVSLPDWQTATEQVVARLVAGY